MLWNMDENVRYSSVGPAPTIVQIINKAENILQRPEKL